MDDGFYDARIHNRQHSVHSHILGTVTFLSTSSKTTAGGLFLHSQKPMHEPT
ncbi:MAG: hypothetical protein KAR85_06045 [Methanosarcinales archaeon]|nr:hypothetical protein [Methanosarcinales archaeon]